MRITDIKAIPLAIPQLVYEVALPASREDFPHVLVKISTDEGITGYGEAWRLPPHAVSTFVEEVLKPLLVGENPMNIESLWDRMYHITFRYGRKGLTLHAISGVEMALWDIIGKYRKIPVYEMIGGLCRDRIKAYASLPRYQAPEEVAKVAFRCAEEGYPAIKLHQRDMESVKAVRQAVGYDMTLMMDVNGAWTPRESVEKAKELEEYGLLWLEEPVSPMDDYDGLAYVREKSNILIASGENEYTRYGFKELIIKGAADVVQPDVTKTGGILECRKIFTLAEAWNLQVATHTMTYGPGIAATLHLCLSNVRSEYIEIRPIPLEAYFIQPSLRPEKGYITVPDKPGLGFEIDEEVVKRYPYTG